MTDGADQINKSFLFFLVSFICENKISHFVIPEKRNAVQKDFILRRMFYS